MSAELAGLQRILIINADGARAVLDKALSLLEAPAQISEARTTDAVLRSLENEQPHCALLEIRAPLTVSEALPLLRQLRERRLYTPVIVLGSELDIQTAVELMKAGATDYLTSVGLQPDILAQRLRQAIRLGHAEAEARAAREAQRESEGLLRLIVDSVPALISYIDSSYRYRWLNRRYGDWFRIPTWQDEAGGGFPSPRPVQDVLGQETFAIVKPYMDRALRGETVSYQRELPYQGGARWVDATYVPHVGPDGRTLGMVVLVQDVTHRRADEDHRRKQLSLEQQLLGIVSHDLRSPISVISMNAAMLLRREDTSPQAAKGLARILTSADRASRMVRDLLDFTQARLAGGIPIERRPTDFFLVVRQMIEELQSSHPDRVVELSTEGDGTGAWDPDRLGQIITNLLTNAVTYSPADTPVRVSARAAGDSVILEVHNQGDAIPADAMPTLFEPFKRGRDGQGGHRSIGLGLYIVKHLVEAHGGRVELESQPSQGTTFRVIVPRSG